jgi:hypothetical protein
LGNPPPNSVKFFAASEVLEQIQDRTWLAKVTSAINQHWQRKNSAKQKGLTPDGGRVHSARTAWNQVNAPSKPVKDPVQGSPMANRSGDRSNSLTVIINH